MPTGTNAKLLGRTFGKVNGQDYEFAQFGGRHELLDSDSERLVAPTSPASSVKVPAVAHVILRG